MRAALIFFGILAVAGFAFGLFAFGLMVTAFDWTMSWQGRLLTGVGTAVATTIAALVLSVKDILSRNSAFSSAQQKLIAEPDVPEDEFLNSFAKEDQKLALAVRQAIAEFFAVPEAKVNPGIQLQQNLSAASFDPAFTFHAAETGLQAEELDGEGDFWVKSGQKTIQELVSDIRLLTDKLRARREKGPLDAT